jgi:D-beta-D-heptose 7-phosphate kinase/D-beta-D-heptose 1-phosphate adenosyltransferase
MRAARSKIGSLDEVRRAVEEARRQGKTVALAHGGFDVLRVGDVRRLQRAKAEADLLVVGVSGDESVRRLEGEGRPILPSQDRALLVAALRAVDHVVLFEDHDLDRLLVAFRPDVHRPPADRPPDTGEPRKLGG